MHIFYQEPAYIHTPGFALSPEESRHCCKVLRLQTGDQIGVLDGCGNHYTCQITKADPKGTEVQIQEQTHHPAERPYYLHIALAPTKNMDRTEWFVEKCVETGIDEITFLQCGHSERKKIRTDRIQRIAIAAMKQSQRYYVPKINALTDIYSFLEQPFDAYQKFIAHQGRGKDHPLFQIATPGQSYVVMIGPEGDFNETEIEKALHKDFLPINLGPNRLRTETAGLLACHTLALQQEVR